MVEGIGTIRARIDKLRPALEATAAKAMEEGAEQVVETMRRFVPRGTEPLPETRTQRLWQSIGWTWGKAPEGAMILGRSKKLGGSAQGRKFITIYAGNSETMVGKRQQFQLARLMEFGAKDDHFKAHPFFFPAWRIEKRRVRQKITTRMRRNFKKMVEQGVGG